MRTTMAVPATTFRCNSIPSFTNSIQFQFPRHISNSNWISNSNSKFTSMASTSQIVAANNALDDVEILRRIQSHQEKATRIPAVEEIRTVIAISTRGKYDGYPYGSMVDFACDADGSPILAVSSLAVHTKDLLANPKCSLLIAKDPEDRTDVVITVHGDAVTVAEGYIESVRSAYLTKHANAFWVDFGDFQFLKLQPTVVRYVSGVATALMGSGVPHEQRSSRGHKANCATLDNNPGGICLHAGYGSSRFQCQG